MRNKDLIVNEVKEIIINCEDFVVKEAFINILNYYNIF